MATKNAKPTTKRKRIDWEAVERDYRTDKFTLKELEAKHSASYSEISRKAKREGWKKDLREAIRHATNAAVLQETAKEAQSDAKNVVLAAAELNKQVILKHRTRLATLVNDTEAARQKLTAMLDTVADVREAATLVGAIESLSRTTKNLIDKEREAFSLDAKEPPKEEATNLSDAELDAAIAVVHGRLTRQP
jgi:hypothetical protein